MVNSKQWKAWLYLAPALALLMAAFLGMCLLVERKRIVVAGERIVVQPALGRRRATCS